MSKDQYTVHDRPEMKPKTVSINLEVKHHDVSRGISFFPAMKYDKISAREFVDTFVNQKRSEYNEVLGIIYFVNVKADK